MLLVWLATAGCAWRRDEAQRSSPVLPTAQSLSQTPAFEIELKKKKQESESRSSAEKWDFPQANFIVYIFIFSTFFFSGPPYWRAACARSLYVASARNRFQMEPRHWIKLVSVNCKIQSNSQVLQLISKLWTVHGCIFLIFVCLFLSQRQTWWIKKNLIILTDVSATCPP